ncbi:MAG: hypothetical protein M1822_001804 [Bathelium mastoideum]|nr:MAG: hypothetical protein M1822_001804 [Bathelium mastoideum]
MNKSIEKDLASLVPTLNVLPPALINLSASLLAQSRAIASTLKPEEEIARTYTCTHLACERQVVFQLFFLSANSLTCERLKQTLNLPRIEPKPPCQPRVYKKLYQYLSNALPSNEPRTPKKQKTIIRESGAVTPSSSKSLLGAPKSQPPSASSPEAGRSIVRKRKAKELINEDVEKDVPGWAMPAIRHLCKTLDAPAAIPHVYAGLCSVLQKEDLGEMTMSASDASPMQSAKRSDSNISGTKKKLARQSALGKDGIIAALLVVLYLYTMTRLSLSEISGEVYIDQKKKAMAAVRQSHELPDVDENQFDVQIEIFIRQAQWSWLDLEWFINIPEGQGVTTTSAFALADDTSNDRVDPNSGLAEDTCDGAGAEFRGHRAGNLEHGLGSMFVSAVDYLSKDRRQDYKRWRAQMMKRIEEIESQRAVGAG